MLPIPRHIIRLASHSSEETKQPETYLLLYPRQIRVQIPPLNPSVTPAPGCDACKVDAEGFGEVADGGRCEDV